MKRKSQDKISNLPDSILLYILSLPPIQFTVVTSVIAYRWWNLSTWCFVQATSLDFGDEVTDNQAPEQFIDFVNGCRNIHVVKQIEKFWLCSDWLDAVNLIGFAMRKSLKKLHLDFSHIRECYYIKGEIVSDPYIIENSGWKNSFKKN
ncbi:hypothetical protein NE237_021895 [Protea cynaroides]|uniref:F-box domain-containing protein n=1 Tax=Protea cynaroides TaxID=273540 RepID=A0A9Q0K4T3_9MAGN|nr:hypothetical protein NE237_021895 [Protea cynaroides]